MLTLLDPLPVRHCQGYSRREFLKPGDTMETEVEGIGKLRNRIVAAARD